MVVFETVKVTVETTITIKTRSRSLSNQEGTYGLWLRLQTVFITRYRAEIVFDIRNNSKNEDKYNEQ